MSGRRVALLVLALCGAAASSSRAQTPEAVPASSQPADADQSVREIIRRLSGTQWALELQPMFGQPRETPAIDTLSFAGEEMSSELFAAGGFPASVFTVTIGDGGVPVWEASQLNPNAGIILWRGELHEQTINGTISKCPLEGAIEDFTFVGREVTQAPVAEPAVSAVQPEPQSQPESEAPPSP